MRRRSVPVFLFLTALATSLGACDVAHSTDSRPAPLDVWISGRVLDQATGLPVPDVRVAALAYGFESARATRPFALPRRQTITQSDGSYSVRFTETFDHDGISAYEIRYAPTDSVRYVSIDALINGRELRLSDTRLPLRRAAGGQRFQLVEPTPAH